MADSQAQKLLQGGIKAAQTGQKDLALRAFRAVLKLEPENEGAWLGIATVTSDKKAQLLALKKLLTINPDHAAGQEAVRRLGIDPARLLATDTSAPAPADESPPVSPIKPLKPLAAPPQPPAPDPEPDSAFDAPEPDQPPDHPEETDLIGDTPDYLSESLTEPDEFNQFDEFPAASSVDAEDTYDEASTYADDAAYDEYEDYGEDDLTSEDDDFSFYEVDEPDGLPDAPLPALDTTPEDLPAEDLTEADDPLPDEITLPEPDADQPLFAGMPPPSSRHQDGIPVPPADTLTPAAQQASATVQAYLQTALDDYLTDRITWEKKTRRRAGETEMLRFRIQVGAAAFATFIIVSLAAVAIVMNNPEFQRIVLAPTWTVSPTPTFTATNTPGVTPTPSHTPPVTLTPSPTLPATVTPGNALFTPSPSPVFAPVGVVVSRAIEQAVALIDRDNLDEALAILAQEKEETRASGDFQPYYYTALIHLERDDFAQAEEVIQEGEALWQERASNTNYGPLVDVAYARLRLNQIERELASGARVNFAMERRIEEQIDDRLTDAVQLDSRFIDAYLLQAERQALVGDYEEAFQILNDLQNGDLTDTALTDTRIRLKKAELYLEQDQLDLAMQELNEVVTINPYQEAAQRRRVELALLQNDPGLAVLLADEYLFYHPDRIIGYKLRGDARRLENKPDLALLDYAQALQQGDESSPAYLLTLLQRADLYRLQQRYALALDDLSEAVRLSNNDPAIREQRMRAAYFAGEYDTAMSDIRALRESGAVPESELDLLEARILVDQAASGDTDTYSQALRLINIARLPDEQTAIAYEYQARIYYQLDNMGSAFNTINNAIAGGDTGTRRYLRGLIRQARADASESTAEYQAALDDYGFILSWSRVYAYPFLPDVEERYETIRAVLAALQDDT